MSKSIPLDEYLSTQSKDLTDGELELQLATPPAFAHSPQRPSTYPESVARTKGAVTSLTGTLSAESETALRAALDQMEIAAEDAETVDTAVKAASHGVKVLAPLLNAISRWIDPKRADGAIEATMGAVLNRVRKDALIVATAYGLKPSNTPPWLTSQISGQIMELLIQAIDRNNGQVIADKDSSYLAPLINLAHEADGIAGGYYGSPSTPSLQLINALTMAAADVMSEYHVFSYFRPDAAETAQVITDFLNERVLQTTLDSMTERFNFNDNERAYFGGTLLRGAGKLLADAWVSQMASTLEMVKEMPQEQRRGVLVSGYPLDAIFDEFERAYQGLEISSVSAIRALSPHREVSTQSNVYAPRFG